MEVEKIVYIEVEKIVEVEQIVYIEVEKIPCDQCQCLHQCQCLWTGLCLWPVLSLHQSCRNAPLRFVNADTASEARYDYDEAQALCTQQ